MAPGEILMGGGTGGLAAPEQFKCRVTFVDGTGFDAMLNENNIENLRATVVVKKVEKIIGGPQ
jgi:hypothetical protein